jgi:hypothetical protein
MPSGITLINADGLTPNTSVGFVSNAWVVSDEVTNNNVDTCALSTSWYTPAGTSDDWMITPQINGVTATTTLSWEALSPDVNYADGYEVWVTSSIAGTTPVVTDFTTGGTMVFSITAEAQAWTPHVVGLAAFGGGSVYVAFRNNSTDKYILEIDDILVEIPVPFTSDLSVANSNTSEYTYVPLLQMSNLNLTVDVNNPSADTIPDVVVSCNVYLSTNLTTPIQTLSNSIPDTILLLQQDQYL